MQMPASPAVRITVAHFQNWVINKPYSALNISNKKKLYVKLTTLFLAGVVPSAFFIRLLFFLRSKGLLYYGYDTGFREVTIWSLVKYLLNSESIWIQYLVIVVFLVMMVLFVRLLAKHYRANLHRSDAPFQVQNQRQGPSRIFALRDMRQHRFSVNINGVTTGRLDDRNPFSCQNIPQIRHRPDAVAQIILVQNLVQAHGNGFQIVASQPTVRGIAKSTGNIEMGKPIAW